MINGRIIGTALFLAFVGIYSYIKHTGPDPYDNCKKPDMTEPEQDHCRTMVDFALSGGW